MLEKLKKTVKRIVRTVCPAVLSIIFSSVSAQAADISSSVLATGTSQLISDITSWITGLGAGVTVLMVIYCLIRRNMADEMDHKKWQTRMTVSLVSGVGVVVASAVINVVLSYYGA